MPSRSRSAATRCTERSGSPRSFAACIGGVHGPEVVVDLRADGTVDLANRDDAVQGANRAEVRKVLRAAARRFDDLVVLWDKMHADD